jgi:diadenylate cyclase
MGNFLGRYVFHNFFLKLLSLALAVGLWLAVSREEPAELPISVPIEFHNVPENLEITWENIPQAQILVRGPERVIRRLAPSDIHLEIDLRRANAAERTFDLKNQIRGPRDIEVVQVIPSQLHIQLDTRLTRTVDVRPRVIGSFAPGFSISRVVADPPSITVSGPRQRVEALDAATTDPVDATGTVQPTSFMTHAYVSDPLVQVVRPMPIRVTVIMEKSSGSRR